MAVCIKQSSLQQQIAQLQYITRELNIVTGVHICSDNDDEDCVDTVPQTCDYYSFPESYSLEPEEVESSSGSGSGDGFGTEDDDVCASINSQISITTSEIEEPDTSNTTDDKLLSTDSGAIQQSSATLLTLVLVLVCILWTSCRNYL